MVNTLSSLSGVFVLVMSAIPVPRLAARDRLTLTKLTITAIRSIPLVLVTHSVFDDVCVLSVWLGQ